MKRKIAGITTALLLSFAAALTVGAEEAVTFESFKVDLMSAKQARKESIGWSEDTSEEIKAKKAVDKEWEIMEKYAPANFSNEDQNREDLRAEYMAGLTEQHDLLAAEPLDPEFWTKWDEGLRRRMNVIEEMDHVYELSWIETEEEREAVHTIVGGSFADNGTREAFQIQALLGVNADGKPGTGTVTSLKKKQKELGIPLNGVVNAERVSEFVEVLVKNGRTDEIERANNLLDEGNKIAYSQIVSGTETGNDGAESDTEAASELTTESETGNV